MQFLYFDAGIGAMIAQAAVAVAAGVLLFYKSIKYKIRTLLGLQKDTSEEVFDDIDIDDSTLENASKDDK
ncbi:hypothetical protein C8N46_105297 [Kordia periserrulae]|jgi:hypothetical protein|uniref:Uncharacterized protein n=1 Tax=Kordia periserrulae TaxID=701523 RepID=A0A2T6BYH6_9FLAO|nr:hypothetical protein [Kordia periserrulae]KAB8151587.1 hypothetical protein EZY14_017995 [Kordia sp. TARA_039_SRF]PTX61140.1 hypothetical protein C8N46_105297 [Kordia periserrulae]